MSNKKSSSKTSSRRPGSQKAERYMQPSIMMALNLNRPMDTNSFKRSSASASWRARHLRE
jgi:hypothetical protein